MSNTMWGGRFSGRPAEAMEEINASIDFDRKLAAQDIAGSQAHIAMLARQGVSKPPTPRRSPRVSRKSKAKSRRELLRSRACARRHPYERRKPPCRDHRAGGRAAAHRALAQRPGRGRFPPLGARRDRRDPPPDRPIATGARWSRARSAGMVMPGFTHLQSAQPVTFGHHLLAYVEMLGRDAGVSRTRASGSTNVRSAPRRLPEPRSRSTAR